MTFERNIQGLDIKLRIDNYESPKSHLFGYYWCDCGFSFRFQNIIDYSEEHREILLPEEVDGLAESLTKLLENRLETPEEVKMAEPDFLFMLYPKEDLRKNPKYDYIAPGYEIQDIYVEWRIYFWNAGLTSNFLTVTLHRRDIMAFRDFLVACMTD